MSYSKKLIDFIDRSPSAYHTVENVKRELTAAGFTEISEGDVKAFSSGGSHFVVRNGTSVIAFRGKNKGGFMIASSHSDSPTFKVKGDKEGSGYLKLDVERYGGTINYTWLDRPLSVAGRAIVKEKGGISSRLVNIDKDYAVIPSVAIHMNRTVNESCSFNLAVDLLPIVSAEGSLLSDVAENIGVGESDIISHDLFLYNREGGRLIGAKSEYILSPRLDDLECVYSSLEAFVSADESCESVAVLAVFDNEEVGSSTKQGANSTFLKDTLKKIAGSDSVYYKMLENSFMVSADNAHAKHPNHPEYSDSKASTVLGGGVVIKYNASQRYATDAISDAIFRTIAEGAGAKVQSYVNRADLPGGSTLGSIADTRVSIPTIDIGLPQLAMHSSSETAAVSDIEDMVKALAKLFSSSLSKRSDGFDIK